VLVTGGTGALGNHVTRRLLDAGHRVAVTWRAEQEATELARLTEHHENLAFIQADVTDPDSVAAATTDVMMRYGSVDALVHLVGAWAGGGATHELSPGTWDRMIDINLTSAFLCSRAVLPGMIERDRGRIVLVSARAARLDRAGQVAYAVAKAGVGVLAETIAEETRGSNVTANVVAPSTIDTPANRAAMPGSDFARWVTPDDVAASVEFLIGEAAGALRGAWLPVHGSV
jgi:NAD(P)-dependent dehydrogenase (short-subunit alcohol dehydrogenase family)